MNIQESLLKNSLLGNEIEKQTISIKPSLSADRFHFENYLLGGKSAIFRTCDESRAADPSLTSGMHWIDPDGQGIGDNPIYVYCNMTTGDDTKYFKKLRSLKRRNLKKTSDKVRHRFHTIAN